MYEPKPTDVRPIADNTVIIDPRLTKSRFYGSLPKKGQLKFQNKLTMPFLLRRRIQKMHITKTTKDVLPTADATVAIENDLQGLKAKLKERILSVAAGVDDIVEEIYNQGFRDGLAEGKERTEQELDSAVNNAFANGQNDARATACRLARLKEAGLLFTNATFADIFRQLSISEIESAVDAYYTRQNKLKEEETQTERDMRNAICALYSQFGKDAVTKMWDSINAEGVATIPESLPFD